MPDPTRLIPDIGDRTDPPPYGELLERGVRRRRGRRAGAIGSAAALAALVTTGVATLGGPGPARLEPSTSATTAAVPVATNEQPVNDHRSDCPAVDADDRPDRALVSYGCPTRRQPLNRAYLPITVPTLATTEERLRLALDAYLAGVPEEYADRLVSLGPPITVRSVSVDGSTATVDLDLGGLSLTRAQGVELRGAIGGAAIQFAGLETLITTVDGSCAEFDAAVDTDAGCGPYRLAIVERVG